MLSNTSKTYESDISWNEKMLMSVSVHRVDEEKTSALLGLHWEARTLANEL